MKFFKYMLVLQEFGVLNSNMTLNLRDICITILRKIHKESVKFYLIGKKVFHRRPT
jgi:hypothetical protein